MRYRLRFDRIWAVLNTLLGAGPRQSRLEVVDGTLHVHYGWLLDTAIPLDCILAAEARLRFPRWSGIGVHFVGRGKVVANGSRRDAVRLVLDRVPARTGPFHATLHELWLSVDGRDALLEDLRARC